MILTKGRQKFVKAAGWLIASQGVTWFVLSVVGIMAKNSPPDRVTQKSYSDYTKYSDYLSRVIYDDFMQEGVVDRTVNKVIRSSDFGVFFVDLRLDQRRSGGSSCCSGGSSCCSGGSSCCSGGSSCCSGGSSCCSGGSSCCHDSSCCCDEPSCCDDHDCCSCCSSPSTTTPRITIIPPQPPNPITDPKCTGSTCSNQNHNNITIPINIAMESKVTSNTNVSMPVQVSVTNENNVMITSHKTSDKTECCHDNCTNTTTEHCVNRTITVPIPVPVPVPVPRPVPVPIPYPQVVTVLRPYPVRTGCCQVVMPCIPYNYGGCYDYRHSCGHQCSSQYMYQPIDVCQTGCYQQQWAYGNVCGHQGCSRSQVDCSTCGRDFGGQWDTFQRCAGCFVPMPWNTNNGNELYKR